MIENQTLALAIFYGVGLLAIIAMVLTYMVSKK